MLAAFVLLLHIPLLEKSAVTLCACTILTNFFVAPKQSHYIYSAANYLNIKPLLDLTVLAVSILIKGKSAAELREIFNVTGDTAAEEGEGAAAAETEN